MNNDVTVQALPAPSLWSTGQLLVLLGIMMAIFIIGGYALLRSSSSRNAHSLALTQVVWLPWHRNEVHVQMTH